MDISVPAAAGDSNSTSTISSPEPVSSSELVQLATAAYLARYKGDSRSHARSDLGYFQARGAERNLAVLSVQRTQWELYVRWMQETRHYRPSTVSRRVSRSDRVTPGGRPLDPGAGHHVIPG